MNECGCGCGCKIKLKVDDESPIGLQIIDGETVRVDCADFLIRTDKDYNHLENKPSINDVTLEGNKTLEELGIDLDAKLDKPTNELFPGSYGTNNIMVNNNGTPEWAKMALITQNEGSQSVQAQTILHLGRSGNPYSPEGSIGRIRLYRSTVDGSAYGSISLAPNIEHITGTPQNYIFNDGTPNSTAHVISSSDYHHTTGKLAKFDGGTSITESELTEEDINNKLDTPPETGVGNGLLRNNNGGDPSWTVGAYVYEQAPANGQPGYVQLSLGNSGDYKTPPYGRYGTLRLIMTDGDKRGIVAFTVAPPLVSGEKRAYYFVESNHAQTNNYMLSSANRDNTANKFAVFADGTSLSSGTLAESDIELKANKVTSLSSSSTDTEYPSAKCVYDALSTAGGGVFECVYGTTTYAEVTQAVAAGKLVYATRALQSGKKNYYTYCGNGTGINEHLFFRLDKSVTPYEPQYVYLHETGGWQLGQIYYENTYNKVTSLSAESTDTQYPSAKAVYDAIQGGGGGTDIFVAEFGVNVEHPTTLAEIRAAAADGKIVYAKYDGAGYYAPLAFVNENGATFITYGSESDLPLDYSELRVMVCDSYDGWTIYTPGFVKQSDLATVATSGNYNDLSNKPTIPDIEPLSSAEIDLICV